MAITAHLVPDAFDPAGELRDFTGEAEGEGAVASFIGLARRSGRSGADVVRLFIDHHPRLTRASLEAIAREAAERFYLAGVLVIHRCGVISPGEPIVLAAASSPHRRAALDAVDYMMDRLKTDAVLWKREDRSDGSQWIEPTDADLADRARWSDA